MYEAESKAGYVYIFSSSSNSRLLKIGRTKRHPSSRKRELDKKYREKWNIYSFHWFKDWETAERVTHKVSSSSGCVYRSVLYNVDVALADQIILNIRKAMESTNSVP